MPASVKPMQIPSKFPNEKNTQMGSMQVFCIKIVKKPFCRSEILKTESRTASHQTMPTQSNHQVMVKITSIRARG